MMILRFCFKSSPHLQKIEICTSAGVQRLVHNFHFRLHICLVNFTPLAQITVNICYLGQFFDSPRLFPDTRGVIAESCRG